MTDVHTGRRDVATLVLLSIWLGAAIVVAAVVAPSAFAVLPSRTLAGALVGRVLPTLFWSGAVVGVASAMLLRGTPRSGVRTACALAMVVACLTAQLMVGPRIERVRESAAGPIDALGRDDALRVTFGRLHAASVGLLGLAAVAASIGLLLAVRATAGRDER